MATNAPDNRRDQRAKQRRRDLDPTLMRNQPSLRSSSGTIWVVVGTLFVAVSLIPLVLVVTTGGAPATAAGITIGIVLALWVTIILARVIVADRVRRLRIMAVCLLGIAAAALVGMLVAVAIQRAG